MKDIKSVLNKLEREEKTIEKIAKFLKTKRGQQFVSNIHTASLSELCKRFDAPKFMRIYNSDKKNKNLIMATISKYNINIPVYKPVILEPVKHVKYQIRLTKEEIRKIDSHRPKKKLGFAERMHAYEEHMMNKFITKHPAPTEKELAEDLFPDELKAGYENMLYIRREHIRNILCERYCNIPNKERLLRVFRVLSVSKDRSTESERKPVISEVEIDPSITSSASWFLCQKKMPDIDEIHLKMAHLAKDAYKVDSQSIKVKLYTNNGTLIDSCKCS